MMMMVLNGDGGSARKRVQQTDRYRKQKLVSRLSDSGFEEDLAACVPTCSSSSTRAVPSPLRVDEPGDAAAAQQSIWYQQYGDVGYRIQREREALFYPCKSLLLQPQVTAEARCKLVSWLIPVCKHFRLSFECCCLAVNIMDRFMACTPVAADCFQLLGVTALLLASKKVEVCSPSISHLLSLCCDAFTKEQLCNLECLILLRLHFRLGSPTLAFFLDHYANRTALPAQCASLARKVCELSLADCTFDKYAPSLTASCALSLACELLQKQRANATTCPRDSMMATQCEDTSAAWRPDLAQECRNNLKLLLALNQESLDATFNM
ncbi:cyclin-O [Nerophis lumbriciformis]|uniref:cyclin-O n=1 Tax=Nerophis lumbriciformis TaxID=546530 RepID=UPI002ADF2A36|nr:cyclin-O protein B-like [Nerophis lumbriciformis]XP_061837815.1 cyclin-O protein B-like [Nerophis lumbriciformis]